jgi:ketosteroid isomerase-like protein
MDFSALALANEEQRRQALIEANLSELDKLMADTLVYTHSTSASDSKNSYLAKIANASLQYISLEFTCMKVLSLHQAAVVTGQMAATVKKDGQHKNVASLFMTVWAPNAQGIWQLQAHQGTPLPA